MGYVADGSCRYDTAGAQDPHGQRTAAPG